jgi:hypothetical protein
MFRIDIQFTGSYVKLIYLVSIYVMRHFIFIHSILLSTVWSQYSRTCVRIGNLSSGVNIVVLVLEEETRLLVIFTAVRKLST